MIDVLSMTAVANDIRLSTLEPVQQWGSRLAGILSGELSRSRADIAFALATGATLQTVAAEGDRIRAEQLSSTHSRLVSLDTQAVLSGRSTREDQDRREAGEDEQDAFSEQHSQDAVAELNVLDNDSVMLAVSRALGTFHAAALQQGVSGHPVAYVLPLRSMLESYEALSSNLWGGIDVALAGRVAGGDSGDGRPAQLVLCLAFDGTLGESRRLWGLVYEEDRLVARMEGHWCLEEDDSTPEDVVSERQSWHMKASEVHETQSLVHCHGGGTWCKGRRVCLTPEAGEPERWVWRAETWSWL